MREAPGQLPVLVQSFVMFCRPASATMFMGLREEFVVFSTLIVILAFHNTYIARVTLFTCHKVPKIIRVI